MAVDWTATEAWGFLVVFLIQSIIFIFIVVGIAVKDLDWVPFRYNVQWKSGLVLSQLATVFLSVIYTFNKVLLLVVGNDSAANCDNLNHLSATYFASMTLAMFVHLLYRNKMTKVGDVFGVLKLISQVALVMTALYPGFVISNGIFATGYLDKGVCRARRNLYNTWSITVYDIIVNILLLLIFLLPLIDLDRQMRESAANGHRSFSKVIRRNFIASLFMTIGGMLVHLLAVSTNYAKASEKPLINTLIPMGSILMTGGSVYASWMKWEFGPPNPNNRGSNASDGPRDSGAGNYNSKPNQPTNTEMGGRNVSVTAGEKQV